MNPFGRVIKETTVKTNLEFILNRLTKFEDEQIQALNQMLKDGHVITGFHQYSSEPNILHINLQYDKKEDN
jgi:hypothetical protein